MFPNSTDITLDNKSNISSGTKSYMFDFENGDFIARDGKLIECDGISAIKVWIEKILRTEKGRYSIYSDTEYGCHLEDFTIGNSYTAEFIEVESAVPLTINVSAKLTLANGADLDTAKEKITESITKYLQKNAFSVGYISYAQIGGCILACDEVADYSNLKLNNDTQNISVSETQVPVLGVVTVD